MYCLFHILSLSCLLAVKAYLYLLILLVLFRERLPGGTGISILQLMHNILSPRKAFTITKCRRQESFSLQLQSHDACQHTSHIQSVGRNPEFEHQPTASSVWNSSKIGYPTEHRAHSKDQWIISRPKDFRTAVDRRTPLQKADGDNDRDGGQPPTQQASKTSERPQMCQSPSRGSHRHPWHGKCKQTAVRVASNLKHPMLPSQSNALKRSVGSFRRTTKAATTKPVF